MSFTCPICGMTSHNHNDEINRYCGNCHVFVDDFRCSLCGIQFKELRELGLHTRLRHRVVDDERKD